MGIKKFIKDVTGVTAREEEELRRQLEEAKRLEETRIKIEKANEAVQKKKEEQARKRKEKKEKEALAKLSPKELATKKGEPWVDVIGFKVNPSSIQKGFFELDWNDYWVLKLKQEGYGADGDPEEEIVARWFRDILLSAAISEGINPKDVFSGSIDIRKAIQKNPEVK